ncbi:hypothetical protein J2125_003423 [Erwinia toletana]|uniref:Uncharacterized protein n=1 Tax=Winslowiella toletana TaxID=92490 RepID=A0ABS4PDR3_9GAMM|nr:hypothetical protein [Winslowiella toletana]MBP2170231.1 hypothetical protein [Winslowiella toletana]
MSKYAQAAVVTVRKNQGKQSPDMRQEWEKTMAEYFPTQETSRKKSCPKNAFLGLCEAGLIVGIPAGSYGLKPENVNKRYAVDAVQRATGGITDKNELWKAVAGANKTHNSQMDIVLELLRANLLKTEVS